MGHPRLTTLLATVNVGLLVCALACGALVAIHVLQQFADNQALSRVSQASIVAEHTVEMAGHDLLIETQTLSQRPTLQRLAQTRVALALSSYLGQYCRASQIGACAVLMNGRLLAAGGASIAWESLWRVKTSANLAALVTLPGSGLLQTAWAPLQAIPGAVAMTARPVDTAYARQISRQIALTVIISDVQTALAQSQGARRSLIQQAISQDADESAYFDDSSRYVAALPLHGPGGAVVAVLETASSAAASHSSLLRVVQTLILLTLAVALLAALVSILIGRSLTVPLQRLTYSAARIGAGDLATPIPPLSGVELGTLAGTLDAMREQLQRTTSDLRRQQAEAEAILTGIVEGVFCVGRDRRIRYLNQQAATMLGIIPDEALGRFCGDVLRPCAANGARPCEQSCPIVHARSRKSAQATERLTCGADGSRAVVITSAAPADGQQVQVLRYETEMEASRRMRDTVLVTISHEFQTPLAAQIAAMELLLDQLPDLSRGEIRQLVLASQRGTLRLNQLINNLLESVRIEAGKDRIRRQPVALGQVVAEAVEMTRPLLTLRGQDVAIALPGDLPPIQGDAPRLTQVFVNLLANANKFAPSDSMIHIGGSQTRESVMLWVEDSGPGIPLIEGRTIFDRFVRAGGEEPEQIGMGLGLWIVKSIVERHGGYVDAQGVDGQGARIRVTLPALAAMTDVEPLAPSRDGVTE
jgi:signal transduction histidine kinase